MSQRQLGEAVGLTQSAISRLESHGSQPYAMDILGRAAAHLGIPARLLGLAEPTAQARDGQHVERREFLGAVAALAVTPVAVLTDPMDGTGQQAAALRVGTSAYRRMDGVTPSRDLAETVHSHMRLIQVLTSAAPEGQRARLAAAGSEAASLAGWLAWDMGDYGSARTWYGSAVKAARAAGDVLLSAYQTGSLEQFEAHAGNASQALGLARSARRQLGEQVPEVADAWLSCVEALAFAAGGDERRADRALLHSLAVAGRLRAGEAPPWPWVFAFDESKVASCRITCGARLGLSSWALGCDAEALATGHPKQRALLVLDIAAGHLAAGRLEAAFTLASRAVETGLKYRSGRIVERARAVRRSLTTVSPPKVVRDFDERLYGVYL